MIIILFIFVALADDSALLRICDKVVGDFIQYNQDDVKTIMDQNQDIDLQIVNYFYHLMNNCYQYTSEIFPDLTDDQASELDWSSIIEPFQYQNNYRSFLYLNWQEERLKDLMAQERTRLIIQREANEWTITKLIKQSNWTIREISVLVVVVFLAVFTFGLCYSMQFLIRLQHKEEVRKQNKRK